ncbi:MAG: hypothetical protein ACR2OW_12185 [Methyloligellaceae bacterium]
MMLKPLRIYAAPMALPIRRQFIVDNLGLPDIDPFAVDQEFVSLIGLSMLRWTTIPLRAATDSGLGLPELGIKFLMQSLMRDGMQVVINISTRQFLMCLALSCLQIRHRQLFVGVRFVCKILARRTDVFWVFPKLKFFCLTR